jgi:hypothetical protein
LDGQTIEDPETGYIHVCVSDQLESETAVLAVLIHELVHADQYVHGNDRACNIDECYAGQWTMNDLTPPEGFEKLPSKVRDRLCRECKNRERPAYQASCNYLYHKSSNRVKCYAAGECQSCAHLCPDLKKRADKGECKMPPPEQ